MDKNGIYTSNKINTRRVFGENNTRLSTSALGNLTHGQYKKLSFNPADDLSMHQRIMPCVADEHIWMQSSSGTAAGPVGVVTPTISAKTPEQTCGNSNPYITSSCGWTASGALYDASTEGFIIGSGHSITSTNYSLKQNQTYRVRINYSSTVTGTLRIYTSSVSYQSIVLPVQSEAADFVYTKTHTAGDSTTAKIMILSSGAAIGVSSAEVIIPEEVEFPVSHDTWSLAGSDGVGAYVALVPKKNSGDHVTHPWKYTPTDINQLWKSWFIGQVTEHTAGSPATITVQVGVTPPLGDYKDVWLGHNKQGTNGYGPVSAPQTDCYHIYDLSWWITRGGIFGVRCDIGGINYTLYQYDDVPGGVNQNTESGTGEFYDDYQVPTSSQAVLEGLMTQGNELHGQFKGIRLSTVDNGMSTSGHVYLTLAPDER